jgi:nifR3 family TIM-barrel protein
MTPRPLRIGDLTIDVPAFQGALSGYSDLPMRRVARSLGCRYAIHEVVLDEDVVRPGKLQEDILHVTDDDHPVGGQLLGSTPATFASAARLLVDAGYDVVDINFGCPVKKVLGRCRGGFLLSEPRTALEIVSRVRDAVKPGVPVTLKMRRGLDDDALSTDMFWEILDGAFARGIDAVCVHGRTVKQRYIGPAKRSFLADVKAAYPHKTLIGSGDVFSAHDVKALLDAGMDGAWIARGAIGAPWIFAEAEHLLTTGTERPPPSLSEQTGAVRMHLRESVQAHGRELGSRLFRSAAFSYADAHPAGDVVKAAFFACKVPDDIDAVLARYYDEGLAADHFGPVRARPVRGNDRVASSC